MRPEISIIVPVYNVEQYLARCVKSLINQTFSNIEIILVNDGSQDYSPDICEEYANTDARIKVVHKANGGLSSARNAGLDVATGRFIGFVDSDDWVSHDMYEYLYNLIWEYNCDIAKCESLTVRDSDSIESYIDHEEKIQLMTSNDAIRRLIETSKMLSVCNRIYKRELFNNVRFPEGKINEDFVSSYHLFSRSNSIVVSNKQKYFHYLRHGSITKSGLSEADFDYLDACDEILRLVSQHNREFIFIAKQRRYRASFTLLAKLAYYGVADGNNNVTNQKNKLLNELRTNYLKLISTPIISIDRKILITIACVNYGLFKIVVQTGKFITRKHG